MNKKELLDKLKSDLKAAETLREDQDGKIEQWRNEYDGKPYGNEQKGKSRIVSRDIKKQDEWLHPSILDPFTSTPEIVRVNPVTWEDAPAARQSELLLNYQFCRQFDRFNFMSKAIKVLSKEGTVVVQCGWDYEDEEVEKEIEVVAIDENGFESIQVATVTETVVKKNQPTAVVCRNEDVFIDPTCMDDMDKCQFVIHRYETDYSTLKTDGRYKNLEKALGSSGGESQYDSDFDSEDETEFIFKDKARKKVVVYEYWGNYDVNGDGIAEPIVCAWLNDTVIRLQSNPYPDNKPPFLIVPFNSVPFQMYGESDAELISDNQKIKTAVTRGIIDNMAQSNNGQVGVRKGALDGPNRKKFVSNQNFEFNGTPNDFWYGSFNPIPSSAFDMLAVMNNEIESLTAVKSFSGGISGNSLGGTATGARGAMDATAIRRMHRVRNIAENLVKPLMRKWLAYDGEFLEDQEVVRVTNDEFVEIRRDDLAGRVDLDINVATAEDNEAKMRELTFLLQTIGPSEDPAVRREIMADIYELSKMPEQAKRMREYQPKPDPLQEQVKQLELQKLQLENELLAAQIKDEHSRAAENMVDVRKKTADAVLKEQQARLTGEKADMESLKFIKEDNQTAHQEKLELEEKKRLINLEQMALQAANNDRQIGIIR